MTTKPSILIYAFLILLITSCDYYVINPHYEDVGYIDVKDALDDGFEVCFEEKIFPYYYGRTPATFSYGKDSLRSYFKQVYSNFEDVSGSGYITFRFIINCHGETGRFVIQEVGTDFKPRTFNPKIVDHLYHSLKALEGWHPITFYDDRYDSFIHITFKIENGALLEILP